MRYSGLLLCNSCCCTRQLAGLTFSIHCPQSLLCLRQQDLANILKLLQGTETSLKAAVLAEMGEG